MGILKAVEGTRVYLDTNVFIYALEGFSVFRPDLEAVFAALDT